MRILMIYPDLHVHINYPLGFGYISSVLKKDGHETRIIHLNEELGVALDLKSIEQHVLEFAPGLIAFSSVSNQFQYVKIISEFIKKRWDIPILLGGIHATIAPEKILNSGTIDIICRGEGELPVLDLVRKMENGANYTGIRNMGFRIDGEVIVNPIQELIPEELYDSLPFPDREGFKFGEIVKKKHGWANFMASRGCLYNCSYCVNHFQHKMYAHLHTLADTLRYRKVDTFLKEIEETIEVYPEITLVNVDDDNILLNKEWLSEFCEKYREKIGLPFACNIHPSKFDTKIAQMLSKAGCVEVKIGLESGSERIRRDLLRRSTSDDVIRKAFSNAHEAGLRTWSFNMIGLPTESIDELMKTAKLNAEIRPYIVRCSIFYPYEGTDLYSYAVKNNLLNGKEDQTVSSYMESSILDMPQIKKEEILKFKTMFKWHVDAFSDIEASEIYKNMIKLFDNLPLEDWSNGKAKNLFLKADGVLDMLLRECKLDHYATRRHLDLNYTKKLNYELP